MRSCFQGGSVTQRTPWPDPIQTLTTAIFHRGCWKISLKICWNRNRGYNSPEPAQSRVRGSLVRLRWPMALSQLETQEFTSRRSQEEGSVSMRWEDGK